MKLRRSMILGVAAALATLVAATAATAAPTTSRVTGITPAGAHAVHVTVHAPGDITKTDIAARLGNRWAYVENVTPAAHRRPLHLVIAIDTSDSMAGAPLHAAIASAQQLLYAVGAHDKVGLVTFAGTVTKTPLTADVGTIRTALAGLQTQRGTSLDPALTAALAVAGTDTSAQRVVVLMSDGAATGAHPDAALQSQLRSSGVVVDALGLVDSAAYTAAPLRAAATASKGRYIEARRPADMATLTARLRDRRLSGAFDATISLPRSGAHDLHVSVLGAPPATLQLPPGVSGTAQSFWVAHGELIVALLGFAAVMAISLVTMQLRRDRQPSLASRLADYTAIPDAHDQKRTSNSLLELYEQVESQFSESVVWRHLDMLCQQAGIANPTAQVLLGIAAIAAVAGVAGAVFLGVWIGIACVALGIVVPIAVLRWKATRRSARFEAQLPELLSVWASALRAGRSFAQALDSLVEEADDPARAEFRRAQQQVRLGVPIEQALDHMSQRLRSDSFELVVLTTDVQRRVGGNVAVIFDQVADTVRKRQQFRARVRALTSMGRLSAYVLIALPFGMAVVLTLINADYMAPLFQTQIGHVLIGIALLMMTLGWLVLRRMVKPRVIA